MTLLIPLNSKELEDAVICKLSDKRTWALVSIEEGVVQEYLSYDSREDISHFIDYVVVKDKGEDINDFINEGVEVLVVSSQRYIDDIVEAFMFRELYQFGE